MKHFKLEEFLQSDTARRHGIDMTPSPAVKRNLELLVANILDPLRDRIGLPIKVTSGFRPRELNPLVGGSNTSQHTIGQAADIVVATLTPKQVCQAIIDAKLPFDQLIWEFGSWTHVSFGGRNRRQVLTAKRVGKKVVYTPGLPT